MLFEVPQGSILGHIPFNNFICDSFFFISNKDIYVDDTASYETGNFTYVIHKILGYTLLN